MVALQSAGAYPFWRRYLDVFDDVTVLARVGNAADTVGAGYVVEGVGVAVAPLPYYVGAGSLFRRYRAVRSAARAAMSAADAVIVRLPSTFSSFVVPWLVRHGRPFGVELVGDPYDGFAPGAFRHPARAAIRWWLTREVSEQVRRASAVAYVTASHLQRRYPASSRAFVTSYSSIELPATVLRATPRRHWDRSPLQLVTVGSLENEHKGVDVLLAAVAICRSRGLDVNLRVIGEGRGRQALERLATHLQLGAHVRFDGHASSPGVFAALDQADMFVLASRSEGLPRALIEAMARALPCVGSSVGGIPELLASEDLVPPDDARALAERIELAVSDRARLDAMSRRNLARAAGYTTETLRPRRVEFLRHVRGASLRRDD